MKTGTLVTAVAVVAIGTFALGGSACTGFAVYADHVLYGMNFDYPPSEVRFWIEEHEVGSVFFGGFRMGGSFARTVGMNERGLFASDQMVFPARGVVDRADEDEVFIWNAFYDGLRTCATVDDVVAWIGDRRLVQYEDPQLHNLYADPSGAAMVVESSDDGNVLTQIDGAFLVMTNFHNGDFVGLPLDEVDGVGADRYRIAWSYIDGHLEGFDVDRAFETLRRAAIPSGEFTTQFSVVFDPEALEVFVALERDYDHVWKASLETGTIETYRGFDEHVVLPLDPSGVSGAILQGYVAAATPVSEEVRGPRWPILALIGAGVLGVVVVLAVRD